MHSKIRFIKQAIKNYSQIGAVFPSSSFLAKKMVKQKQVEKAKTIVELGAGTGVFAKNIFNPLNPHCQGEIGINKESKNIFIIEKDEELYKVLLHKFPTEKENIYNEDMLNLENILSKKNLKNIDLIISGIPFRSLPKEIFPKLMEEVLPGLITEKAVFVQFSYIKSTKKMFEKYFENIETEVCYLNIPRAFVFTCSGFKLK